MGFICIVLVTHLLSFADCRVPASLHSPVCHLLQGHQGSMGLHQGNTFNYKLNKKKNCLKANL